MMVTFTENSFFPLLKQLAFNDFVATSGCLLMFAGGVSMISLIELLLSLVRCLKICNSDSIKLEGICNLRLKMKGSRFYHLTKDVVDFLNMSSIHGVQYLLRSSAQKVLWSVCIVTSAALGVHFVNDSIRSLKKDPVALEVSDNVWNARDVIKFPLKSSIFFATTVPDSFPSGYILP